MNKYKHEVVGQIYDIRTGANGATALALVKRTEASSTPLILGQYVIINIKDSEKVYLGRVESAEPDFRNDLSIKEGMRNSKDHDREFDAPYAKQAMYLSYKIMIMGICEAEPSGRLKFYSFLRELPSVTELTLAIPDADFLEFLFKSAIEDSEDGKLSSFEIGTLRYGTYPDYTKRYYNKEIPVEFNAANLLRKRTAIFGKSGYGKSNTVKTVIGMMATKFPHCSQLIFDTNGEYALENDQNDGFMDIFHEAGVKGKVILYTDRKIHASKKEKFGEGCFKPLKFDIFENISAAMDIVSKNFQGASIPMYIQAWINESQGVEKQSELFANVNNKGIVWGIWFKACMDAGLIPLNQTTSVAELRVGMKFLNELVEHQYSQDEEEVVEDAEEGGDKTQASSFDSLDEVRRKQLMDQLGLVEQGSGKYVTRNIQTMAMYGEWYALDLKRKENAKKKDGEGSSFDTSGASSVKGYIELLGYYRRLYQLKTYNLGNMDASEKKGLKPLSLAESIWRDLQDQKIIIVDLASLPSDVISRTISEQIAAYILSKASQLFGDTEQQEMFKKFETLVFIEEAQNYLSSEKVSAGSGIFERLAKEGRKFHIGLVYVTQQPSAIDEKISSQTENIIAMHLSNLSDTMILNKIKDKFDLLTTKFLKDEAQKGLAYLYAEPHQPFVLPAQVHKFDKELILKGLKKSKK